MDIIIYNYSDVEQTHRSFSLEEFMDKKDIRNMGTKQYIEFKRGEYEAVLRAENIQDEELLE